MTLNTVASYFGDPVMTVAQVDKVVDDAADKLDPPPKSGELLMAELSPYVADHEFVHESVEGKGTSRYGTALAFEPSQGRLASHDPPGQLTERPPRPRAGIATPRRLRPRRRAGVHDREEAQGQAEDAVHREAAMRMGSRSSVAQTSAASARAKGPSNRNSGACAWPKAQASATAGLSRIHRARFGAAPISRASENM